MSTTTHQPGSRRDQAEHPTRRHGRPNLLGTYLRARRALVSPQAAGLPEDGVRRVPGLRREEVARLAGISPDYYLRLEQGRDRHPSAQVLDAIGRVLRLDEDHMAHLRTLVAERPPRTVQPARPEIPAGVQKLMGSLAQPAFVEDRFFDIMASNAPARALSPRLVPGGNQLRSLFLDTAERALHPEWERVTECFVANLRQAAGTDADHPRLRALTTELSSHSPRFRELWERHEVRGQRGTPLVLQHPDAGRIVVNRERLAIDGAAGLWMVVFHADAGSPAEQTLARWGIQAPSRGAS